ncbi:MAG: hypothetical protein E7157_05410 [Lactobacillales bacterium]|nr:hypothetical protein [Lactobacillales bacterium]
MRISNIDDDILIYINKELVDIDFEDLDTTKEYFKKLFLKLKNKIDINGFYFVNVYKDLIYGIVIELSKEEVDYLDYYTDEVDMHITLLENTFLYEVEDIFFNEEIINNSDIIYYDKKIYLKLKKDLNDYLKNELIEFSNLIYKDTNDIINYGKKLS